MKRSRFVILLAATLVLVVACQQESKTVPAYAVSEAYGQTTYRAVGGDIWESAHTGIILETGSQLRTAMGSSALLRTDGALIRLAPATTLAVNADEEGNRSLLLSAGRIFVECTGPEVTCEVEMPWGRVTGRDARFSAVVHADRSAQVATQVGSVTFQTANDAVTVGAGQQSHASHGQKPQAPAALSEEEQMYWERWARGPELGLMILTPTVYATETPTNTPTPTRTATPTGTPTPTNTPTVTLTPTPTNTPTPTETPTETPTLTPTPTETPTRPPPAPRPTPTPSRVPGPLDFEYHLEGFYFTPDKGRWGATLVIDVLDGQPPFKYTVDEVIELPGPRWEFQWKVGPAMARSIQVIDARGQKVSKPWYEPAHLPPKD